MKLRETETLELKAVVVDAIKKEVIAFANCDGGTLYVGVNDDGGIVGVDNPDETIQQISNMVRDSIKPDVTMFVRYETSKMEGKSIVAVEVQRGTDRPYYLVGKGLRPEGVYVRQGTSSVPSSDTAIRRMIKETDGDNFEDMRSLTQKLTFQAAIKEFGRRRISFGRSQMKTLGVLSVENMYTNLGLLLSDQCTHTVKVAVFDGTDQSLFHDRHEFTGSLFRQLGDVYDYIDRHNQMSSTFDKLLRIDRKDYPDVAIREALLNSLVHRDYSFSASILISMYKDRLEFVSIGGLLAGVSLDDVMMGLSVCRNPKLANVFYRLNLIEAYGTGLRKIMNAYADSGRTPSIETTSNAFKVVLPNMNGSLKDLSSSLGSGDEAVLLRQVRKHGSITRKDVEESLNISQTAAGRLIRQLVEKRKLVREGRGKNTRYKPLV